MPKTFEDKAMYLLPLECITIAEWCPNLDRKNPTEVHMVIEIKGSDFSMAIRFRGTDMLDRILNELIKYRRNVWPDAPRIEER